ncbi:unnamed protein product, partial [Prorocentrum cordatum]
MRGGEVELVELSTASPAATPYWSCPKETKIKNDFEVDRAKAHECVSVFTVAKIDDKGKVISRLAWNLRKASLRFRAPPWTLGSPAALAAIELSDDMTGNLEVISFVGDVPDFFYRLALP